MSASPADAGAARAQAVRVAVAGASGYVGGEVLRLLLGHPSVEVVAATSESSAGQPVARLHPHLRGRTTLRFTPLAELEPVDVLVCALPHGALAARLAELEGKAPRILDCSADFRLRDAAHYADWYGEEHPCPEQLGRWVYGLPEAHREELRGATRVSGVGCNATAVNLALLPVMRAGLLPPDARIVAEVKAGSSEGGRTPRPSSHHPERSGVVRAFAPGGHRHTAEVEQMHGLTNVHLSVTSIDRVRGAAATVQCFPDLLPSEPELWAAYRAATGDEPFLRVVHERSGSFRHPDLKLLDGTNYADLGWARDERGGRLVLLSAIDNLGKGAAGSAVQCLNLMCGLPETAGLDFHGVFPA